VKVGQETTGERQSAPAVVRNVGEDTGDSVDSNLLRLPSDTKDSVDSNLLCLPSDTEDSVVRNAGEDSARFNVWTTAGVDVDCRLNSLVDIGKLNTGSVDRAVDSDASVFAL
jgi:hypothetical protein